MKTSDFYYNLPKELIAQIPLEPRDTSKLLVLGRESGNIEHKHFYDIIDYLNPGDLLVCNDSRVLPARIFGIKDETGARVEFLLLKQISGNRWETLCKPGKKAREGAKFSFGNGIMSATVEKVKDDGNRIVSFECDDNFFAVLDKIGQMPLPPYITEKLKDKDRYNTIYSHEVGSAAAPTAGLHFTENVFAKLREKGVDTAFVTLHVGLGTFRPVKEDNILDHKMHVEHYSIPQETADKIKACRERGGRVISVGTTSCRTLESAASLDPNGEIKACSHDTGIFIYPGYEFKAIDGLITNFHLPESTLIMLVSAFLGREKTLNAYNVAIQEKYRFFSFGDSMIII